MPSAGLPPEVTVGPHKPSFSQVQWACYKQWKVEWEAAQTGMCQWSTSTFEHSVGALPWACRCEEKWPSRHNGGKSNPHKWLAARSLRHYLRAQSQGQHTTDRLEDRGVERGSARRSSLKGRERAIVNPTNTGTASKATLGKLQRRGWAHMDFSERIDTILNWTELKTSNSEHSSFALLINLCSRSLFYRVWVRFDQRCSNCAVQIMLFTLFLILLLFLLF